ncbi:MAG: NADPH-dependent FMN reductase [Pseudomonadales bacterium]|tara:strand:+ start:2760 stop:3347 length:588 start_codon:yes stop_codon:yes gene_type:complete
MSMRITLIAGSNRSDSQSGRVAQYLAQRLQQLNVETDIIDLAAEPLPLWPEESASSPWPRFAESLRAAQAVVVITPEWHGMACPALKNLFLYAGRRELAHKPALLVGVSSGQGGAYPIAEMRSSSYKNCRLCYLPDHLIVRHVESVMGETVTGEDDQRIRARADWSLQLLLDYANAMRDLHEKHRSPPADFMNGM